MNLEDLLIGYDHRVLHGDPAAADISVGIAYDSRRGARSLPRVTGSEQPAGGGHHGEHTAQVGGGERGVAGQTSHVPEGAEAA
ncbi:hypothetical protein GCM10010517_68380 [Streptosporangium fragile]|uniref:Uncharacterized protein n=1 Tax=Streptosporangium fragile TaxID=46186 RepID=A0ABP6INF9_9ACTN